jgi:hypothetical protein
LLDPVLAVRKPGRCRFCVGPCEEIAAVIVVHPGFGQSGSFVFPACSECLANPERRREAGCLDFDPRDRGPTSVEGRARRYAWRLFEEAAMFRRVADGRYVRAVAERRYA